MRSGGETAAAVAGRRRGENGDHAILMFVFKVIRQRDIKWMYNFHNILDHTLYQIAMKRGLGAGAFALLVRKRFWSTFGSELDVSVQEVFLPTLFLMIVC